MTSKGLPNIDPRVTTDITRNPPHHTSKIAVGEILGIVRVSNVFHQRPHAPPAQLIRKGYAGIPDAIGSLRRFSSFGQLVLDFALPVEVACEHPVQRSSGPDQVLGIDIELPVRRERQRLPVDVTTRTRLGRAIEVIDSRPGRSGSA